MATVAILNNDILIAATSKYVNGVIMHAMEWCLQLSCRSVGRCIAFRGNSDAAQFKSIMAYGLYAWPHTQVYVKKIAAWPMSD